MKLHLVSAVGLCLLLALGSGGPAQAESVEDERAAVERVVLESYMHGAFNEQNTEAMRQGFHPIFKIHGSRDGELSTYPIADWIERIEARKQEDGYEPQTWEHRFPMTDVTGDAAMVKVELIRVKDGEKKLLYTDYLSLLKFDGQWRITDKVYHRHP